MLSGGKEGVLVFWKDENTRKDFCPRLDGEVIRIVTDEEGEFVCTVFSNNKLRVVRTVNYQSVFVQANLHATDVSKTLVCDFRSNRPSPRPHQAALRRRQLRVDRDQRERRLEGQSHQLDWQKHHQPLEPRQQSGHHKGLSFGRLRVPLRAGEQHCARSDLLQGQVLQTRRDRPVRPDRYVHRPERLRHRLDPAVHRQKRKPSLRHRVERRPPAGVDAVQGERELEAGRSRSRRNGSCRMWCRPRRPARERRSLCSQAATPRCSSSTRTKSSCKASTTRASSRKNCF